MITRVWLTKFKSGKRKVWKMQWYEPKLDEQGVPILDENGEAVKRIRTESTGTGDRTAAESYREEKQAALNGLTLEPESERARPGVKLSQLKERDKTWLETHGRAEGTIYLSELAVDHFIETVGDLVLTEVTQAHRERFVSARRADDVSARSINREVGCVRAAFNRAVDQYELISLEQNRFARKWKSLPEKEPKRRTLTPAEQKKLLKECRKDGLELETYVSLALDTGARANEISHLLWSEVDLKASRVTIKCTDTFQTKTRKNRTVPIQPPTAELLKRWHVKRGVGARYVFTEEDAGPREHYKEIAGRFNDATDRAKLKGVTLHSLRHTFATDALGAGVPLQIVSEILGHRDITTTARIYSHPNQEMIQDAADKVAKYRTA